MIIPAVRHVLHIQITLERGPEFRNLASTRFFCHFCIFKKTAKKKMDACLTSHSVQTDITYTLHCIALVISTQSHVSCIALHCIALHCIVLHCITVLHCIPTGT
jgi:hypothetical protein